MGLNDCSPDLTLQSSVEEKESQMEAQDLKTEESEIPKLNLGWNIWGKTVDLMAGWLPGISVLVAR